MAAGTVSCTTGGGCHASLPGAAVRREEVVHDRLLQLQPRYWPLHPFDQQCGLVSASLNRACQLDSPSSPPVYRAVLPLAALKIKYDFVRKLGRPILESGTVERCFAAMVSR